jgi:hypothetical protein
MRNPLQSTGWIARKGPNGKSIFLGTCFAFRRRNILLTAAHCVRASSLSSLSVYMHGEDAASARLVTDALYHPHADLAILRLSENHALSDRFDGETPIYAWGVPVSAFGYPEDTGLTGLEPTPRYFRGNIQRMFRHTSHLGYAYEAAELSFGAPGGLSGGPVTPDTDYSMVMGVVAENQTSTTYLSTITEEVTETTSRFETIHSVIDYAIVVRLDPVTEWLDQNISYPGANV